MPSGPHARAASAASLLLALAVLGGCAAPDRMLRKIDEQRQTIGRGFYDAVDAADRAFGEPRVEDRERLVRASIGLSAEPRENNGTTFRLPISTRVPLPALERRANVFLQYSSAAEGEHVEDLPGTIEDRQTNSALAAVILTRIRELDTGVRFNLGWHGGPQTGVEPFVRREWNTAGLKVTAEQRVSYTTDDHLGGTTALNVDRRFADRSFLRFANSVAYHQELHGTDLSHALIYRRPFLRNAMVSAEGGLRYNLYDGDPTQDGVTGAEADGDEGYLSVRTVGKLWRPWIEYEIMPAWHYVWRHADTGEWGITFTVRLLYERYLRGPAEEPAAEPQRGAGPDPVDTGGAR